MLLKIGELAKRTGMTVRALHHYDAIGLLCPSARTDAGYRLYDRADIERLHRIQALRGLDLSLSEVASLLEGDSTGLQAVIEQQIALLDRQASRTIELRDRLKHLLGQLSENEEPDLSGWLDTLAMMAMYNKYFTDEELAALRTYSARLNKNISAQATALVKRIRELMERNAPVDSHEVQEQVMPWMTLLHERMGGDPRLMRKLDEMHRNEPAVQILTGVDDAMIDYMAGAVHEYRMRLYGKYLNEAELARIRKNFLAIRPRWLALSAGVREQMERDPDPSSPAAQELCARWLAANREMWGPDPAVHEKMRKAHDNEPDLLIGTGISMEMINYIRKGIAFLTEQKTSKTGSADA